ncbi:single-stranded-DNA-specific exonuclease RecJ [Sulfitobacter sp. D35]|uniref:single-stranded-DNA-specific exonuclease RecJ n=1 Tax=Sulfitobacter sp. D35 TaxID=3083252 RepID=UPI00296E44ED|nr:single-stranded-DNA-specific exonuclease RecJ [Sulfitobacter sp. D35]MDW4496508.1 single-stranded-DNA-specific exonuclease RecJ [Sulfitobacter sp. D35]
MSFLGVEASLTGRRWVGPGVEAERAAEMLVQRAGLPLAVAQVLARREVPPEEAEAFLAPSLRETLPDPRRLRDMEAATERFLSALDRREKIAIFADYDVDGGASAALLLVWLREMGHAATLYIPDRIDEGYGPNVAAMEALASDHDLIVCVDCGTLSHEPIAAASAADVIVLDHHLGGETLPPALAVVNPNRQDEDGSLAHLCAAGVVFLMLVEAGRRLREAGRAGPDLMGLLDLVALATVADVAPLVGANRAFVRQGLRVMSRRERPGLAALSDVAHLDCAPTSYHLGFLLGPRVNAGGRIGAADLGARLLATADAQEAEALAQRLDLLNSERRDIEAAVRASATAQAEARGFGSALVWAAGEGWHPGVVGIVASRLKEASNRPAIVIGFENGIGKGSGRSVSGIDLGAAIHRLVAEGLLIAGGGHKMAAGLTVAEDKLDAAMARLDALLEKQGAHLAGPADLRLDGTLMPRAATLDLAQMVDRAGPFGAAAPAPRYAFADMTIRHVQRVGENHLKLRFCDDAGTMIDAIGFGAFDSPLGPVLSAHGGARFHLAGRLDLNTWRGKSSIQLRLEDAAPA